MTPALARDAGFRTEGALVPAGLNRSAVERIVREIMVHSLGAIPSQTAGTQNGRGQSLEGAGMIGDPNETWPSR